MFNIYDYTNDRTLRHCYQQKKSNQFIDFIERVDSFFLPTKSPKLNIIEDGCACREKPSIIVRSEINQILDKQYKNGLRITMPLMGKG